MRLKARAAQLLGRMTPAEKYFLGWCKERDIFPDPQWPIRGRIVDFRFPACVFLELDGGYHFTPFQQKLDEIRTEKLQRGRKIVVRATNDEALKSPMIVLTRVWEAMRTNGAISSSSIEKVLGGVS